MKIVSFLVTVLISSTTLLADDVYVIQGFAWGPYVDQNRLVMWSTDAFFYNTADADRRVTLMHISNGGSTPDPSGDTLVIPPKSSRSLISNKSVWRGEQGILWVLRLDTDADVLIDSTLFIGESPIVGPGPSFRFTYGKARLPVFRSLTPPGKPQVHLATSLGPSSNNSVEVQVPSRLNVAIYNAANVDASATIDIRQHCDDRLLTTRTVAIPADTILQVGGFEAMTRDCPSVSGTRFVYTVVTVDKPSFSYVSNLSDRQTPITSISITSGQ